ncbi:MAG: hypothetical protein ABIL09_21510 [Gemmatimonadota bacterium]
MHPVRRATCAFSLLLVLLGAATSGRAEIRSEDLNLVRTVTERDWLNLRLEVLGLRLSYPAYRVELSLGDGRAGPATAAVSFRLWLSGAMAEHLQDAGRAETERVFAYHARGIASQVGELLRQEFPEVWPRYDAIEDVAGLFLAPGEKVDDPPRELARWAADKLEWTAGP